MIQHLALKRFTGNNFAVFQFFNWRFVFQYIFIFFLPINVLAIEIRYDGLDCNSNEKIIVTSKVIVEQIIGNQYQVRIEGGLPSTNPMTPECMDKTLRDNGAGVPWSFTQGYAIYQEPYLVVIFVASKDDSVLSKNVKRSFQATHVFTFQYQPQDYFVLLRETWMGTTQEGIVKSNLVNYDSSKPIVYQLIQ